MAESRQKKRYMVSLTPSVVDRFQQLARELGMPRNTLSSACEDAVRNITEVFQTAKDKGVIGLDDLYRVLGRQLDLLEENKPEVIREGQKRH